MTDDRQNLLNEIDAALERSRRMLYRHRPAQVMPPPRQTRTCRLCGGLGSIPGFWLGSVKTCTSCHGAGIQP